MSFALGAGHAAIFAGCVFLGFSVNFAITCPKSLTPELFPTEFRGTAIAFTAAVGRIGGFCAPLAFGVAVGAGMSFGHLMLLLVVPLGAGRPRAGAVRPQGDQRRLPRGAARRSQVGNAAPRLLRYASASSFSLPCSRWILKG